jgi:hypothetical protein
LEVIMGGIVDSISGWGIPVFVIVLVIGFILCFFLGPAPSFRVPVGIILSIVVGIWVNSAVSNIVIAVLVAIVTGVAGSVLGFFGNEKHKAANVYGFSSIKEMWNAEAEWKKSRRLSTTPENEPPDNSVKAAIQDPVVDIEVIGRNPINNYKPPPVARREPQFVDNLQGTITRITELKSGNVVLATVHGAIIVPGWAQEEFQFVPGMGFGACWQPETNPQTGELVHRFYIERMPVFDESEPESPGQAKTEAPDKILGDPLDETPAGRIGEPVLSGIIPSGSCYDAHILIDDPLCRVVYSDGWIVGSATGEVYYEA